MKRTTVGLVLALVCSCREAIDNPTPGRFENTTERQEAIREIIGNYLHRGIGIVRGPLTVAQVQEELAEDAGRQSGAGERVIPGGPEWKQLKAKLKRGDELYFCRTDPESWSELRGREGYIGIRGNEVIGFFLTLMN